jgi:hypothetical protein
VDALALLGHTNYDLSLRRRETMKPSLNKEYASLCSSQTSVTSMLFGDELQSQLNAIRASNRISQTATQSTTGHFVSHNKSTFQRHPRNDREKSFLSKGPNPRWSNNRQVQQEVTAIDKDIITHLSKVKVNEFLTFLPVLKEHFNMQISHFRGGRLAHFYHEWEKITSDREILDIVSGQRIEFDTTPLQNYPRSLSKCTEAEQAVIRAEIVKLLHKAVIVRAQHEPGDSYLQFLCAPKRTAQVE